MEIGNMNENKIDDPQVKPNEDAFYAGWRCALAILVRNAFRDEHDEDYDPIPNEQNMKDCYADWHNGWIEKDED